MRISSFYKNIETTNTIYTSGYLTGTGAIDAPVDLNTSTKTQINKITGIEESIGDVETTINSIVGNVSN